MNVMRIFAGILATGCLIVGFLMSSRAQTEFGHTLFISGAIIVCGILISSAILEINKKR